MCNPTGRAQESPHFTSPRKGAKTIGGEMKWCAVPTTNWGDVLVPDIKPDEEILMWADMISDRMRMDELCGLLMAFREEIYARGKCAGILTAERSFVKGSTPREEGRARAASDAGEVQGVSERGGTGTTR